jgi:hypothetical protein
LANEDQVGEAEVYGEGNDGGYKVSPNSAYEVCDVADEPDDKEGKGYAICGALPVVFYELRDLGDVSTVLDSLSTTS